MSEQALTIAQLLADGIDKLGLNLDQACQQRQLAFVEQLQKWNKIYSLTAIRSHRQSVSLHILDSLALLPFLHGRRIIDVGTGPGLPGIPLALARPDLEFTLLDSNGKKTRFLTQMKIQLGLKNVQVIHSRVELYKAEEPYDMILTRAFGSVFDTLALTDHLTGEKTRILLMKSRDVFEEQKQIPPGYHAQITHLKVPYIEAERNVLQLVKAKPSE